MLGSETVYKGNVSSSLVRVAEVLSPAIRRNCPSLIMVHNHPSGDPTPSPEDVLVTRKVARAAEMMDLALLDHVVIGGSSNLSMKNKGLGFGPGRIGPKLDVVGLFRPRPGAHRRGSAPAGCAR